MMERAIDPTSLRSRWTTPICVWTIPPRPPSYHPHQRVVLTCQLVSLSSHWDQPAAQDLLQELCTIAAGMLQKHDSSLCLDERQQALSATIS